MTTTSIHRAAATASRVCMSPAAAWTDTVFDAGADGDRGIRLLVLTSLYPNAVQPHLGRFVEERLRRLVDGGGITATVVAPVPWFPFRHRRFGRYAAFARVPACEERHGIRIEHPRHAVIPRFGMNAAPELMYRALLPVLRRRLAAGDRFDLIDAHYFHPDGVVAARLGMALQKPVVITARGSDVNVIPRYRLPRRRIRRAADRAAAVVTVSAALKARLEALGVPPGKVTVLRNGVDLAHFAPRERSAIRAALGLAGPVWLAVGNLAEAKGVHVTLEALAGVPDATLLVAGQGPDEAHLRHLAERLGVGARVRFLGAVAHAELCGYYNAADAMVLATRREGMPNVVLESLACGTPVIVTPFEGVAEVVASPAAGRIAASRTAGAIRDAWNRLQANRPDTAATRRYAERFGWEPVIRAQRALYADALRATNDTGRKHGS